MNTVNYGNQKITLSYFNVGTSKSFNQRNYKILPMGIYSKMQYDTNKNLSFSNGNVTKLNSTTARISPFIAEVRDFENNISIRIETQENIDVILTPSEPYLIIKFEYGASQQNYASIVRSSYAMLVEDYIVIAKGIFDSSNVLQSTFDYSRRHNIDFTFPFITYNEFPLKVLAQEPMTNKVNVLGGIVSMANQSYSISNTEITFTMPISSKRIDLLYISNTGNISVVQGVENASPIIPNYENKLVIAEIHLDVTKGIIDGSDIIQVISNYRQTINSSIPTFDQILINDFPTEDNHAVTKEYVDNLLEGLDWQESVKSFIDLVTNEPSTRNVGDRYIATATGTSNLTGTSITVNHIYQWTNIPNNHWIDITPDLHTTVCNEDNGRAYNFNGTIWVLNSSTVDHNYLAGLQGGTSNQYYHLTSSEYTNIFIRNIHTSDNITEGSTNLFYTEGRVSANTDVAANTTHRNITNGNPHGTLATQISDFDTEVSNNIDVTNATTHIGRTDNPHSVTKDQVGLGNVDNVKQIPYDQLGVANGVATLNASGIIYENQLPIAVRESLHYMGSWDASSGNPPSASPNNGEFWIVNTNGSYSLDGIDDWKATDWVCYINATWRKIDNTDKVISVNGYDGVVVLDTDDIDEGSSNLYFTDLRVTNSTTVVDHENRLNYIESSNHIISYQDIYLTNNNLKAGELFNDSKINGIPHDQLSNFTMSYDSSTRVLSLNYIDDWYYYVGGNRYDVTGTINFAAHANTNGLYFFFFDSSGNPNTPSTVAFNIIEDCTIAIVYYVTSNDGGSALGTLFDERHGVVMSAQTHQYLHNILRTQYYYGGKLTGYTLNTDTVDAVTYQIASARFADEDLIFDSSVITDGGNYRLWYYDGSKWNVRTSAIPYFINGSTNNIQYNNPATGLVDISTDNRWVNYYLALTNTYDDTYNVMIIPGQAIYSTLADAQAEQASELDLTSLPFMEMVFFKKVTLKYESANSTTTGKAEIDEVSDITYNQYSLIGTGGVTSHAALTGRGLASQHPISAIYGTDQYRIPYMGTIGLEDSADFLYVGTTLSAPNINIGGDINGGSLFLGRTVNTTLGVIYKENVRWLHDFHHPTGSTYAPEGRNIFLGEEAGNFTMGSTATAAIHSSYNIGIGYRTLYSNTIGFGNLAFGYYSLYSNTTGSSNLAFGESSLFKNVSGSFNIAFGESSLFTNVSGSYNIAFGYRALYISNSDFNIGIGFRSGYRITTGTTNVFVGRDSGYNALQKVDASNSIAIGYNTYTTKDNQVILGNSSITETLLRGNVGIGIVDPISKLHIGYTSGTPHSSLYTSNALMISGESAGVGVNIIAGGNNEAYNGVFKSTRFRGTLASPEVPILNDCVFSLLGAVYDTSSSSLTTSAIIFDIDGTVSTGVAPQRISFWTGDTNSRIERMRIGSTGLVYIGTTMPFTSAQISISGGQAFALVGASVTTDATSKNFRIGGAHYTNAEEPVGGIFISSSDSASILSFGGGSSLANSATDIRFYTAADTTTTTGNLRLSLNSSGQLLLGPGSTHYTGARLSIISDATNELGIVIGSSVADATRKFGRFAGAHYTNAEEPVIGMHIDADETFNLVNIGGGTTLANASTEIRFYTAANTTTITGTRRTTIDSAGNLIIGSSSAVGTNAAGVFVIQNGTEPTSSPADMVQLYSVDLSDGNATLGLRTERAVVTESVTSDRTLSIRINGTTYKLLLKS